VGWINLQNHPPQSIATDARDVQTGFAHSRILLATISSDHPIPLKNSDREYFARSTQAVWHIRDLS
jgi:hypothetical protein